ncbi:MAG TPA: oligosaccharide flippase family protein [Clostridia bacterium]|nr:oligosaccharide flippase family protein [Clostridiaceae bacterium]HOM34025.1 oligosaccharide flippase family protein [Clostridia bacterium]
MLRKTRELTNKISQSAKASLALLFSGIITKGIAYIATPFYTRLLTSEEFGQTSVFLTWVQVFGIIAMFCLSSGVFNNGMVDFPDRRDEYSFSMLILSNIITIIFGIVLFVLRPFISFIANIDLPLILLMLCIFLFQPAYNFWVAKQRYELKYKYVVIWSVILSIISPTVAIIAILNTENHLYARIFGAEVSLIVVYIGFYIYTAYKSKFKIKPEFWKVAIIFNLPLIPHYLSTYLLGSSDKIMISYLVGDEATAYYSVAYSVAAVVLIVWFAINSSLIPYTYEKCKEKDYLSIAKVTTPIMMLFAAVCVIVILLAPEAVRIMATEEYKEAIYVIPPIVGGVFFQVQYYLYANVVYYYKKPKYVMIASLTATITNIILNYVFIKKYGYFAAGYTTLVSYMIQALIDYLAMKKVVGIEVYNMRAISILSGVVIFIALFGSILYSISVVRYIFLVCIFVLLFAFRKNIITLIRR